MDVDAGAIATIVAAFIGGGLGAVFAARVSGSSTENAATISATAARAVAEATLAAQHRVWLNDRARDLVDTLVIARDRHYRQAGAQRVRRQEVARGVGIESSIPRIDPWTDDIRELAWRLSLVADPPVVDKALELCKVNVAVDLFAYDAARHFNGTTVVPLTPLDEATLVFGLGSILTARDELLNAYRAQLGQPPIVRPPSFPVEDY